jgi:hypothetical protein
MRLERGFAVGTGYDQVWVRRGPNGEILEIRIVEAKGPGAPLSTGAVKGDQMSPDWVYNTAREMARSPSASPEQRRLARDIVHGMETGNPPVRGSAVEADPTAPGGYRDVPVPGYTGVYRKTRR